MTSYKITIKPEFPLTYTSFQHDVLNSLFRYEKTKMRYYTLTKMIRLTSTDRGNYSLNSLRISQQQATRINDMLSRADVSYEIDFVDHNKVVIINVKHLNEQLMMLLRKSIVERLNDAAKVDKMLQNFNVSNLSLSEREVVESRVRNYIGQYGRLRANFISSERLIIKYADIIASLSLLKHKESQKTLGEYTILSLDLSNEQVEKIREDLKNSTFYFDVKTKQFDSTYSLTGLTEKVAMSVYRYILK